MPKTISERLAEKMIGKEPDKLRNRAAFLALRDEITVALQEGWSRKVIWELLKEEGKISFCYDSFLRYAKKYVAEPETDKEIQGVATERTPKKEASQTPKKLNAEAPRFRWDERKTRKEDLV